MSVRFAPVDKPPAECRIYRVVVRAVWQASVGDSRFLDAGEDDFKLGFAYTKAVVLLWNGVRPLVKVDRQFFADVHQRKRPDCALLGPRNAKQCSELSCCGNSVFGRHDEVVELDRIVFCL